MIAGDLAECGPPTAPGNNLLSASILPASADNPVQGARVTGLPTPLMLTVPLKAEVQFRGASFA
jgi:hypothetical protein